VEKEVKGCKIMIYDPTHPRKNLTLSITGNAEVIERTKQRLIQRLNSDEHLVPKINSYNNLNLSSSS
jgi:hypothetical protein